MNFYFIVNFFLCFIFINRPWKLWTTLNMKSGMALQPCCQIKTAFLPIFQQIRNMESQAPKFPETTLMCRGGTLVCMRRKTDVLFAASIEIICPKKRFTNFGKRKQTNQILQTQKAYRSPLRRWSPLLSNILFWYPLCKVWSSTLLTCMWYNKLLSHFPAHISKLRLSYVSQSVLHNWYLCVFEIFLFCVIFSSVECSLSCVYVCVYCH